MTTTNKEKNKERHKEKSKMDVSFTSPIPDTKAQSLIYGIVSDKITCQNTLISANLKPTFRTTLSSKQLVALFYSLIKHEFISPYANPNSFKMAFGYFTYPQEAHQIIEWIKPNSTRKDLSKKGLIDLLGLLSKNNTLDSTNLINNVKYYFGVKLTHSNIANNKGHQNSEYYNELKTFIDSAIQTH